MATLKAAVYVQDPGTREELILLPGQSPDPEIAALVTNPDAWDLPPGADEPAGEAVAVGEPDPTKGRAAAAPTPKQDGGNPGEEGAKKSGQRRTRSSSAA